jgi:DNA-binding transcriptional MerR regulator
VCGAARIGSLVFDSPLRGEWKVVAEGRMSNFIQIGRFSRITRLSVKALRRYADDGLLLPAFVDPASGYRYYTYAQARDAELIRLLRSLDVPISGIRQALAAPDRQAFTEVLDEHRRRIEGEMARQERMLAFLHRLIETEGTLMSYEVNLKSVAAQFAAVVRSQATAATMAATVGASFGAAAAAVQRAGATFSGPPFFTMASPPDDEPGEIEVGFPVSVPFADQDGVIGIEMPSALVAYTVHRGPYDEAGPAYQAVEAWIQEHGHAGVGAPREVYLTSPGDTADPQDYVTEIQFPVVVPE